MLLATLIFMVRALTILFITCCVTHLYVRFLIQHSSIVLT